MADSIPSLKTMLDRMKALGGVKIYNKRDRPAVPSHVKYCGRPTMWGNPFEVGRHGTRDECCDMFEAWFDTGEWRHIKDVDCPPATEARRQWMIAHIQDLRGSDLECWCWPNRCHTETLANRANCGLRGQKEEIFSDRG